VVGVNAFDLVAVVRNVTARRWVGWLDERTPVPPGIVLVVTLGASAPVRLLSVALSSGSDAPVLAFCLLAGAGLSVAVLAGLWRGFGWGWYGTIVLHMVWTLEAAARYDVVFVVLWFLSVEYLYDRADRYVDLDELGLFRASV
jgi:hypothetical protein